MSAEKDVSPYLQIAAGATYRKNTIRQEPIFFQTVQNQLQEGKYKNTFHFVEASAAAGIKMDLLKTRALWSIGLNVGWLASADALQFYGGRYFKDDSYLNKTQVAIETAFYIQVLEMTGGKFFVAPFYQYQFVPLASEGILHEKHLNTSGLKIRFEKNN